MKYFYIGIVVWSFLIHFRVEDHFNHLATSEIQDFPPRRSLTITII